MTALAELAWDELGDRDAPPLVLGHSLGSDRSMWDAQVEALSTNHRVIRVDLRGHGASPSPPGPYTIAEIAGDVLRVADAAGAGRFHYCGVSLGGMVGLCLAARHPDRIDRLVAANTASKIGTAAHWAARIEAVRASGLAALRDGVVVRWFAPAFAAADPRALAQAGRVFASTDLDGYVGCCSALATADLTPELGQIRAPSLIIGGALDASTPVADAESLHVRIAGSTLHVLPGAAHLSNVDSSGAFNAAVAEFLGPLLIPERFRGTEA